MATLLVRFALIFFLATFLSPADVGLYGLITVTVGYALYFAGFDFYTFSTRDLLGRDTKQWPTLLATQGVFFLFLYGVVLPSSLVVYSAGLLPWWVAGWVLALIVTEHLSQEFSRLIITMGYPLRASVLIFVRQGIWPLFLLGLMWYDASYRNLELLLWLWLLGSGLCVFCSAFILKRLDWSEGVKRFDWRWIRRGIIVALPLLVATLALRGLFTADRYIFKALNGAELLGVYTLYMGVAATLLTFMDAGVFVFHYPKMIESYNSGEKNAFFAAFGKLRTQTLLWIPVLLIGAAACGPWVFALLPKDIYSAYLPLYFGTLVAISIFVLGMIPHYGLYAMAQDKPIIWAHILAILVFAAASFALREISTLWAVTWAMMIASAFILIVKTIFYRRAVARFRNCTSNAVSDA